MSTNENDKADLPIRRYKSRGNRRNLGVAVGAGIGVALGAATGEMAVWIGVGIGVGLLVGGFLQIRANRS